ncbi:hypothetical protein NBRC3293_0053 [Gluconobacter oxydans NBRC 3293]|uniref:DUF2125 domain-containing protein n=1 Tax=Gluconobacter oxydans NBRC 3293 TaxID=1315969 RepID=A0A829X4L7_GLUOY|nr:hypothetical protein NBRC3293_0053 [Gluconobacter oxydans NBRC 3293]
MIAVLAISAALDTVFWLRTVHRLDATARTALTAARENGWRVETTPLHWGGWPFGAWVELDRLNGTHPASAASPYDAGWAGEKIRLGGSWLSLTGHQAARLVVNDNVLTVLAPGLQIRFRNPENLVFSAPRLQLAFSGRWPDRQFSAQTLSGRLIRFPAARPDATRLGLIAHAATVNGFPLPYGLSSDLRNARLAIALTASQSSPGLSLLDPTSYGRLILQDASATPVPASPDTRITLTGALALPEQNGTLALTMTHWQELASRLLDRPEIESHLAPDLQAALQKLLQKASGIPAMKERPFSLSMPVVNGQILPDAQAVSALVSQGFRAP